MLSKPSMTPLKTSIFIDDLTEPSYDIKNKINNCKYLDHKRARDLVVF